MSSKRFRRLVTGAVLLSLGIVALAASKYVTLGESGSDLSGSLDRQLEALRGLPYLSWNREAETNPSGATTEDAASAWHGYNLFTNDVNEAYVVDMNGRVVHTWILPTHYRHCEYFELLEGGDIVVVCVDQGILRLGWDSEVKWEVGHGVHHDVAIQPDGTLIVPVSEEPRPFKGRRVKFDALAFLAENGREIDRWSTYEHLDELQRLHAASRLDSEWESGDSDGRFDYYHLNSIQVLPENDLGKTDPRFRPGNLLICLRNADLILILDQDTREVVWHWGPGQLELPHMPRMLENGHILIFDNGTRRGHSRVVELHPATGSIVWQYPPSPSEDFFSAWRGSSQRLPNGNTLICVSEQGHAFEVTRAGEIVWEYWNPDTKRVSAPGVLGKLGLKKKQVLRKRIYRMVRVRPEQIEPLLEAGS